MPNYSAFNLEQIIKMSGNDKKAMLHLTQLFLETSRESIALLEEHRINNDLSAVLRVLHRLKPNIEMFGMKRCYQELVGLEAESVLSSHFLSSLTKLIGLLSADLDLLEKELLKLSAD